jgi:multidrug efflux pump subunit AcrA (membrane-fusion protein)
VLIPTVALQIGQQGPYVYVVANGQVEDPQTHEKHPATIAQQRLVKPGQRQGDLLVVESGVQSGEQVVTLGHMMVQPGAAVSVMPQQGAAPPPGGAQASGH